MAKYEIEDDEYGDDLDSKGDEGNEEPDDDGI